MQTWHTQEPSQEQCYRYVLSTILMLHLSCRFSLRCVLNILWFIMILTPQAVARVRPTRPEDFESQSCWKPGQSCGFQAKPGRNITKHIIVWFLARSTVGGKVISLIFTSTLGASRASLCNTASRSSAFTLSPSNNRDRRPDRGLAWVAYYNFVVQCLHKVWSDSTYLSCSLAAEIGCCR